MVTSTLVPCCPPAGKTAVIRARGSCWACVSGANHTKSAKAAITVFKMDFFILLFLCLISIFLYGICSLCKKSAVTRICSHS